MLLLLSVCASASTGKNDFNTERYMKTFIDGINNRDESAFYKIFNIDAFVEKVFSENVLNANYKKGYKQGLKRGFENSSKLLVTLMPDNGYAKLIRLRKGNSFDKALVRFDLGDNGYSFREFIIDKRINSDKRIYDWYDYTYGQKFSEYNRNILAIASPNRSIIKKILNLKNNRKKDIDNLLLLIKTLKTKDAGQALKLYKGFDESFRKIRSIILISYSIASRIGSNELYRITLSDLGKYHGDEASLNFVLIDHYYYQKKYDKAISAIDTFMQEVGKDDAALIALKANLYSVSGNCNKAVALSREALRYEVRFEEPYWVMLNCHVNDNQYEDAVKIMSDIENKFNIVFDINVLQKDAAYNQFMGTSVFKNWYMQSMSKKEAQ